MNTAILLLSGLTVTYAHYKLLNGKYKSFEKGMSKTIYLGLAFLVLQGMEYFAAPFTISDGVYGSVFFMATGFHGFHVCIGTAFLTVCLMRS